MSTEKIILTDGTCMLVDDEDYHRLNRYTWFPLKGAHTRYACTSLNGRKIKAHRFILSAVEILDEATGRRKEYDRVDHINGDGLDNWRQNLRLVTRSQNAQNSRGKPEHRQSRFKGVSLFKRCRSRPWRVLIHIGGKQIHLGYFAREVDAARAYNKAANLYHGEFAYLNTLDENEAA